MSNAIVGTYAELPHRINEVNFEYKFESISTRARFFYIPFRAGTPNLDDFVDFLYYRIVEYCIPLKERRAAAEYVQRTCDHRKSTELHEKAKSLFIQSRAQQSRAGEPGELILFSLLEGKFGAPQLACKMYLKTSTAMPVHGSDGIHALYDQESEELRILWGESKLHQDFSGALSSTLASVRKFLGRDGTPSTRPREIQIVRDHISIENETFRKLILDHFDPYSALSNRRIEAFACLVGFDYDALKRNPRLIESQFVSEYQTFTQEACREIAAKIGEQEVNDLEFIFLLLPFESLEQFRKKFFLRLGVSID
ncbi:MAG: DUF1837 domain-containing protein [Bdellovibrionaceae bacterium]|nr:DUF1837 domain-containing protein [Pseudobdellovibrionaceae bacterium]